MATYRQIQEYVKETKGYVPKTCWIAHAKELNGLSLKAAPNRHDPANRKNPCPKNKQQDILEASKQFGM